jgi:hypothetical protein
MANEVFLKERSFYKRKLDPISSYVEQCSLYISKMKNLDIDTVRLKLKSILKDTPTVNNPIVAFYHRENLADKSLQHTTLNDYIKEIVANNEILVPSFTSYVNTSVARSLLTEFTDSNIKSRSISKKEAFKAKAEGNTNLYVFKNNEQSNKKKINNSMSGAFASDGTVLCNPSAHSSLTSTIRMVSTIGCALLEKLICGNRHYRNVDICLWNLIVLSKVSKEFEDVVNKYKLKLISVEECLECIRYSTDIYFYDKINSTKIVDYVNKLTDMERCSIVYTSDLYHIRKYNSSFIKTILEELIYHTDYGFTIEESTKILKEVDDQVVSFVHYIHKDICKGIGKDYSKLDSSKLNILASTCKHIENFFIKYSDFIKELVLGSELPCSVAYINDQYRKTTLVLDTDSNIFSVDDWTTWYDGTVEDYKIAAAIQFICTKCTAHNLAILSSNIGVEDSKLYGLAMKPEWSFESFALTPVSKHYYATKNAQEGNVFIDSDYEIKGVNLKSSALPQSVVEDVHTHMKYILEEVRLGHKFSIVEEVVRVIKKERYVRERILAGDPAYFKKLIIKDASSYKLAPELSNYFHHSFWMTNFSKKYNYSPDIPYEAIRISLKLDTTPRMNAYMDNLEDRELASNMKEWFTKNKKTHFESLLISKNFCEAFGLPKEIVSIVDVDKLVYDLLLVDRIVLNTLGIYIKKDSLVETQYAYLLKDEYAV